MSRTFSNLTRILIKDVSEYGTTTTPHNASMNRPNLHVATIFSN